MTKQNIPRGGIRYPKRYKQLMDFSGLQFERKISPTDIDFYAEFRGEAIVIGEFKKNGVPVPCGQKRALTTMGTIAHCQGLDVLVFIARHSIPADEVIDAAHCRISEYFCPRQSMSWLPINGYRHVREFVDSWRVWHRTQPPLSI